MSTKGAAQIRSKSISKKLVLRKQTLRDLTLKGRAALDVRGNISSRMKLGNNYGC